MQPHDFIVTTIREAGKLLLKLRDKGFETSTKGGDPRDIVTSVDLEVNNFIVARIKDAFPEDAIYSEESGGMSSAKRIWAIDPIDGSANFSRGIPHYAVCLGLLESGIPTVGAVYNPVTDELFSFEKGRGAFLNDKRISVSATTELSKASLFLHAGRKPELWTWGGESYTKLLGAANKIANYGGSALDACFVAAGRIEGNIYGRLTVMDIASAIGILLEAGGRVVNERGEPIPFSTEPTKVVMSNNESIERAIIEKIF